MATLFGKKIKDTYKGLLKTGTNQELDATLQDITDGKTVQEVNLEILLLVLIPCENTPEKMEVM